MKKIKLSVIGLLLSGISYGQCHSEHCKDSNCSKSMIVEKTITVITGSHDEMAEKARMMRLGTGEYYKGQPKGTVSTHLMAWGEGEKGKFYVWPTITNKTESGKYESQSFQQALKAGEVFLFSTKKEAEEFAAGSWKK